MKTGNCIDMIIENEGLSKVLVAHPFKQHSYRIATALEQTNRLFIYSTTVYDKPGSFAYKMKRFLPEKYRKLIEKKKSVSIPDMKVRPFCELMGFGFIVFARLPLLRKISRYYGSILIKRFGKNVAKYAIKSNVNAVVMYDTTADSCFRYLKKHAPNIRRILDVSSNASMDRLKLYRSLENHKELHKEFGYLWNKGFQKRNMKEIENTDFFLVPSRFSEKSLLNQGVSSMSIIRIPYGVDCSSFNYVPRENKKDDVINLVYTGVISYEKGVNYLLQAVSEMPSDHFTIDLMGVYSKDSTIYKTFSKYDNIHFRGYVSHKELALIYEKADAFFMASLGEGFTLSGLEAMACGLPVVCSENSGINDVIKDYKNGMVFEICNVPTIKEKMQWLYDNRSVLPLLSKNAHETSLNFTWESYYSKVNEAFNTILAK